MWLINHTTLREFEVPLLIDMGYEVFCPKSFPYNEGNLSASIEWKYDSTLTIPREDLEILNKTDFYNEVPGNVKELMNKYFDIVFFVAISDQIKMVVNSFNGYLVFRTFGLAGDSNYAQNIILTCGYSTMLKIEKAGKRFFWGYGYESMMEVEPNFIKNHGIYLPLGLKNTNLKNNWTGGDKRIFFVCPRINTSPYFRKVYESFKEDFREFDYIIGGAQPVPVKEDPKVLGFIPGDQYEQIMKTFSVMFYHSREKRHIHYHPFEAIKNGMPLIFMAGGLLDSIGGIDLPGRAKNIKDARRKIRLIMNGDRKFISRVVESQKILLEPFKYEYCRKNWEIAFSKIDCNIDPKKDIPKRKRVAIIMGENCTDNQIRRIRMLTNVLNHEAKNRKDKIEIIVGYDFNNEKKLEKHLREFRNNNVSLRSFKWTIKSADWVKRVMELRGYSFEYAFGLYVVPDDGMNFFYDCNYAYIYGKVNTAKLFMEIPFSFITDNLNQRYCFFDGGEREQNEIENYRSAYKNIVFDPLTAEDMIQYAGIRKQDLCILPPLLENYNDNRVIAEKNQSYFLWYSANVADENILEFMGILDLYYQAGGELDCKLSGDWSKLDMIDEGKEDVSIYGIIKSRIKKNFRLRKHLKILTEYEERNAVTCRDAKMILNIDEYDEDIVSFLENCAYNENVITTPNRYRCYYNEKMGLGFKYVNLHEQVGVIETLMKYERSVDNGCERIYRNSAENVFSCIFEQITEMI